MCRPGARATFRVGLGLLASLAAAGSRADENLLFSPDYFRRVIVDAGQFVTAPLHWDAPHWAAFGGCAAASIAAYHADGSLREDFLRHVSAARRDDFGDVSRALTHFGDWHYELPTILGFWATGLATGSPVLNRVAADAAEASLFGAGMVSPLIVWITGRDLPRRMDAASRFHPFTLGRCSFPSGHTTEAFAVATVLDRDLRDTMEFVQTPFLYAAAAGVGFSRMYDQAHYLSDVVAGACIGTAVGVWVTRRGDRAADVSVAPYPGGAVITWSFAELWPEHRGLND